MTKKAIITDLKKCTGCMACTFECSFTHDQVFSYAHSRIDIVKNKATGVSLPLLCGPCPDHVCIQKCPVDAITFDPDLNFPKVNTEKCTSCEVCVHTCPLDAIKLHPTTKKALICDLCNGTPKCVDICLPKALTYLPISKDSALLKIKSINEIIAHLEKVK
jgi:Fe-S-cluster-containing hydrogenase component 2